MIGIGIIGIIKIIGWIKVGIIKEIGHGIIMIIRTNMVIGTFGIFKYIKIL